MMYHISPPSDFDPCQAGVVTQFEAAGWHDHFVMWRESPSANVTAVLIITILFMYWDDVSDAHICSEVLNLSFDWSVAFWYVRDFSSLV